MISVLVVFGLLGLSGLLAHRSMQRMERATVTVAGLDPAGWHEVTDQIAEVTDELGRRIADRIDR